MSLSHLDRWPSANTCPRGGPGNSPGAPRREPCVINRCRSIRNVMHVNRGGSKRTAGTSHRAGQARGREVGGGRCQVRPGSRRLGPHSCRRAPGPSSQARSPPRPLPELPPPPAASRRLGAALHLAPPLLRPGLALPSPRLPPPRPLPPPPRAALAEPTPGGSPM